MNQTVKTQLERFEAAFHRISRTLAARGGAGTGLSPSQRIAMSALKQGPLQVSEVAAVLGVTLSAATGLVDRLVRYKLASRERDLHDRRVVWVRLTEEGQKVLADTEQRRREVLADIVQPLNSDELAHLCDTLERITASL